MTYLEVFLSICWMGSWSTARFTLAFNKEVHIYKSGKIHTLPMNTTQQRKPRLQSKPITPLCLSLFRAFKKT